MSVKIFRRCLNLSMVIAILGTIPYMIGGQTQYRHEVYGTTALVLAAFHCIENRYWFVKNFRKGALREPSDGGRAARFRDVYKRQIIPRSKTIGRGWRRCRLRRRSRTASAGI